MHSQFFEDVLRHAFYVSPGSHGHKHWRFDPAMGGEEQSAARRTGASLYLKFHGHLW
jgi:hypothetical protein